MRTNRRSRSISRQQTNNRGSPHGIRTFALFKLRHKRGNTHERGFFKAFSARQSARQTVWNGGEIFFCVTVDSGHSPRRFERESRESPVTDSLGARHDDLARGMLKHKISRANDAASACAHSHAELLAQQCVDRLWVGFAAR
jgi:hypothetical protein